MTQLTLAKNIFREDMTKFGDLELPTFVKNISVAIKSCLT